MGNMDDITNILQEMDEFFKDNSEEIDMSKKLLNIMIPVFCNNIHNRTIFLSMVTQIMEDWIKKNEYSDEKALELYALLGTVGFGNHR